MYESSAGEFEVLGGEFEVLGVSSRYWASSHDFLCAVACVTHGALDIKVARFRISFTVIDSQPKKRRLRTEKI